MIVAIVNGYKIKEKEYSAELKCVLSKSHLSIPKHESKLRAIDQLIDGYLLLQEAKREQITITQEEVDDKIIEIMLKYRTETEFKEMLFNKNLNIEQLRDKITNDILIEKFFQKHFLVTDKIPMIKLQEVYQENLESFRAMDLVRVSHILIKGNGTDALQKATEIRERISSEIDFQIHAKKYSECPSRCKCGDLGYVQKGTLLNELEQVIFNLNVNQISEPIKTEFGYHLVMVTEKKEQKITKFEDVKFILEKRLQQIDCELKLIRYLKKIRAKADIEIFEEYL
jgi:parvulin-like peptidyl-prolyl isomerase